ncbi:MotA/TolQ/ExbB proton channel family protein [Stella sp.]|uniref:MotA/TolQ/ExbB proton channel family protein n=1 Tax=Stella sp. TaxID=2912054 RepID=UPI0035B49532
MDASALPDTLPAAAQVASHLSFTDFFLHADPVVKAVMLILVLGSIGVWAVVVEKMARGRRLRRSVAAFAAALDSGRGVDPGQSDFARNVLGAAARELAFDTADESLGERRARVERAARRAGFGELKALETGLPFLATVSSAGPFIGLFGTVWGIMNSFSAIAASQDTSLAVVAPGIAEALFATALGLIAAVPAVVAYNRYATALRRLQGEVTAVVERLGGELVHRRAAQHRMAA